MRMSPVVRAAHRDPAPAPILLRLGFRACSRECRRCPHPAADPAPLAGQTRTRRRRDGTRTAAAHRGQRATPTPTPSYGGGGVLTAAARTLAWTSTQKKLHRKCGETLARVWPAIQVICRRLHIGLMNKRMDPNAATAGGIGKSPGRPLANGIRQVGGEQPGSRARQRGSSSTAYIGANREFNVEQAGMDEIYFGSEEVWTPCSGKRWGRDKRTGEGGIDLIIPRLNWRDGENSGRGHCERELCRCWSLQESRCISSTEGRSGFLWQVQSRKAGVVGNLPLHAV